jgi:DNA-binding transcriptional ArsR family regulator
MTKEDRKGNPEREKFEALSHPTRIKILQALSKSPIGYADLKRAAGLESSGLLSFHLSKLSDLVEMKDGTYTLNDEGRGALKILAANSMMSAASSPSKVICLNCGKMMVSYGKQAIRMGNYNTVGWVISAIVVPDIGEPMPFNTYVCESCGKVELFADESTRKMLKGEFADDNYFVTCPNCKKKFIKDIEKCPYCGSQSPRFKGKS